MKPKTQFQNQPKDFWANVRIISQEAGYTERRAGRVKVPTEQEAKSALENIGLSEAHLAGRQGDLTKRGKTLMAYFTYRAKTLNDSVESHLMNVERAKEVYEGLHKKYSPRCPIPMNKQKGDKKAPEYLTGIVNILIEQDIGDLSCNYDPRELITITANGKLLRTFSRRFDGAFPSTVNPVAVWEIKQYYYTTTFGSRVADGIYETLLYGMELEELREHEGVHVKHYLIIDAYYTWWECGRPYLCRIFDMLHMGYVDEVLFGYEVVEEMPSIVSEWVDIARTRSLV